MALLCWFPDHGVTKVSPDAMLEGTGVNALDSSKSRTVTRKVSSNLQPQETLRTFETKRHGMLPFEDTEVVCTVKKHEANDRSL
ncbi:unnamed protein product [Rangifer tarandus platyrhynchus]|uniref:Uncharacterized protein n=2 Tax=Rangifer tarandus platyrhynchus TaxID=3082113 RepID=A0ACB0F3M3_RANTA|nr:unnamed protein product [Rangifer tarandus platyrhynchus]CAI9707687.1 unnamed protein product [Rangifer tarandus platyrhynchus]